MPTFAILFLTFFVCSLLLLVMIVTVLFPVMFHAVARTIRISRARRLRDFRFDVGEEVSEDELCRVEAIYHFEADSPDSAEASRAH